LASVRNAIDHYAAANNGRLPGADGSQATFKSEIAPYLREFPVLAAGRTQALNDEVLMTPAMGMPAGDNIPTQGWKYYYNLGVFIVNYKQPMASDLAVEYDDL
jgi:hypothetical protein